MNNLKSEETGTVELHPGHSTTPNVMPKNVYENESTLWFEITIFIADNSMINQFEKKRLSKKDSNVKVRYFSGALVEDKFYNLVLLLRKKSSSLILQVSTNNTVNKCYYCYYYSWLKKGEMLF